jgi:murein DD-endopeptidase MepM/ murein hydrolase activator NlpD
MLYDGHPGIDYSAPCGTEVYAVAAGTVRYPRQSRPGIADPYRFHALELELDQPRGYKVYYLHLATHPGVKPGEEVFFCKMPPLAKEGQHVEAGELIGRTGDAGAPPHLHFEVHFNGVPVDPYGWKGNGQDPYELTRKVKNINLWK